MALPTKAQIQAMDYLDWSLPSFYVDVDSSGGGGGSIVTSDLILHLDAGDSNSYSGSGTTWTDLSGEGHNGTLTNGPTYTSDNGGAIILDGVNDFINVSATDVIPSGTNSFTYSIWVYIDTVSGSWGGTKKAANLFTGDTSGTAEFNLFTTTNTAGPPEVVRLSRYGGGNSGSCEANVSMNNNTWYNITLVKDGASSQKIYQDGVLIGTGNLSNSFTGGYAMRIGSGSQSSYGAVMDGRIASVLMYSSALSASEVLQNYNATKDTFDKDHNNAYVNVGGTWKQSDDIYVNVSGTWKNVTDDIVYVNINGSWKSLTSSGGGGGSSIDSTTMDYLGWSLPIVGKS